MRLIRFLIALLCIAAGVVVGALNPQPVSLDLGFTTLQGTLGVSMLLALLAGAIAGGLVLAASVVVPLRQQLRRERARNAAAPGKPHIGDS
ncbi:lipopolysaccharide assembly protein LapA domain-containing protein [Luteimonas soli]|uniref:Lipopolysaccharide assembly protein LapA domain-containing protein n=1 Tax=Luteimonas soli TaxID=1648966 RepID=A0ABV7XKN4_9GAMM